jgi:hypothetical protein
MKVFATVIKTAEHRVWKALFAVFWSVTNCCSCFFTAREGGGGKHTEHDTHSAVVFCCSAASVFLTYVWRCDTMCDLTLTRTFWSLTHTSRLPGFRFLVNLQASLAHLTYCPVYLLHLRIVSEDPPATWTSSNWNDWSMSVRVPAGGIRTAPGAPSHWFIAPLYLTDTAYPEKLKHLPCTWK